MDIKTSLRPSEVMLGRTTMQRKLLAFLVSATAFFSALVIGWSWSIHGYQTQSEIVIQTLNEEFDRQEFQVLVADTIRTKVTDAVLSELLAKTKAQVSIQSPVLGDLPAMRKAILVQTLGTSTPFQIRFTLLGKGTRDEQVFLKDFTTEFSNALASPASSKSQFVVQNSELARYRQVVDDLEDGVSQLEREIGEVNQLCQVSNQADSGPFRTASHRKDLTVVAGPEMRQLQSKVADLDLAFLQSSTAELKTLLNTLATGGQPYALPEARPIGTPQPKQLLVLLLLAAAFGVVVASHFQPFANKGFANLADVATKLKIPVVAALPINPRNRNESLSGSSENRKLPWANRVTRIATGWLLAVAVLIAGFCCISEEIREIFFRNPVDGLARAFWYFKR